ncbi:ScyD/ScyE family protein [uncultured Cellulomonas sp.]|uniref:ScyD/ScyE family protein n=1 Tax=uncultured Cellulomonas sp. TaxID=189682 RepID=UPI0028E835B0|nr:ScyD/ScyE family protein [uncultured Cellulomonas sp.]
MTALLAALLLLVLTPTTASAHRPTPDREPRLLVGGLSGGFGSTVGPDGALYVTEQGGGEVSRIDPRTGAVSLLASGLPTNNGTGVTDVAFVGRTAYVLTTFVTPEVGGTGVNGVFRVDGPTSFTLVADLGAWAAAHPPASSFFVKTGVQYAFEAYKDGFLVTDGHHNRVYRVGLDGSIAVQIAFENVVPTGLDVVGARAYLAQSGPVPHLPQDGKIVTFGPRSTEARQVASGGPLMLDVQAGHGHRLYALAQGTWPLGGPEGSPAAPDTGLLYEVGRHGSLEVVADGLDQPVSFQVIRGTAYVVTLGGEVWTVDLGGRHGHH